MGEDVLHSAGEGSLIPTSIETKGIPPFGATDADIYVKQDLFREVLAADLGRREAAVMAASQRPIAFAAVSAPSKVAAWKSIPSWSLIPRRDRVITPERQRFMAERAGSKVVEVNSSHVVARSVPTRGPDSPTYGGSTGL